MTDTIGRGVIELSTDGKQLRAGIDEAKRSLNELGITAQNATKASSASIDRYVRSLGVAAVTMGKSTREAELYRLGLRGATDQQIKAADAALRMSEAHERGVVIGERLRTGMIAGAAAATALAVGLGAMLIASINALDHLNDLHKTTGITVGDLAGLGFAAKQSGSDLDGVADAVSKLSKNIGKEPEKFKALGITAKEPLEAFRQLADIFVKIEDPQLRAAFGAAALGKSWASAAPLLSEGGAAIGDMVAKGKQLSGVTDEMAESADKFNDQLVELKATSAGLTTKLAAEMLPAFNQIIAAINLAYQETGKLSAAMTAMGALGSFLFTDTFSSAKVKIQNLREEIATLEQNTKNLESAGGGLINRWLFGSKAGNEKKIADLKGQIESLQQTLNAPPKPPVVKPPSDPKLTAAVRNFVAEPKAGGAKERDTSEQDARAQLALDIDLIKRYADAKINTLGNAEKTISALRDAGRVEEKDYFDYRREILDQTAAAQEEALQKEIARLQQEKFSGDNATKNELDNKKKIADAEAQLAKVRENAGAARNILAITEDAANVKRIQQLRDAEDAANDYLDALKRGNLIALAGQGAGTEERSRVAARAQIEDAYTAQRRSLEKSRRDAEFAGTFGAEAQRKYDDELERIKRFQALALEEYDRYYQARLKGEADWSVGAREALKNYQDEARNVAKQTETLFTRAFQGMEDALVEFVKTGKLDFKSLADSIISDLIRIQIKAAAVKLADASKESGGLFGLVGKFFGMGGGSDLPTGGPGITEIPEVYAAATGADWMVGGSGGTDSKIAQFRVTPGERIVVQTPEQQRAGGGGGDMFTFNVDARGADAGVEGRVMTALQQVRSDIVPMVINAKRRGGAANHYLGRR